MLLHIVQCALGFVSDVRAPGFGSFLAIGKIYSDGFCSRKHCGWICNIQGPNGDEARVQRIFFSNVVALFLNM